MFDIGFWELMMIGLIALLVVGPERLPKLAYTAGRWVGKARGVLTNVKQEIDKEIKAEELKQVLEEQKKKLNPMEDILEETGEAVENFRNRTEQSFKPAADPSKPQSSAANQASKPAADPPHGTKED